MIRAGAGLVGLLAWLSALGGCAAGDYGRPGATYADWKRDDAECRRASSTAPGGLDRERYEQCMRGRGYAVGRP